MALGPGSGASATAGRSPSRIWFSSTDARPPASGDSAGIRSQRVSLVPGAGWGPGPLSTNCRDRGKETLMRLSLRNLLGRRTGTTPARPRPAGSARLDVERLDERAVPAAFN